MAAMELQAQSPKPMAKIDWALLEGVTAVRVNDAFSSHYAGENGGHEQWLLDSMGHNRAAMLGFGAGMVGVEYVQRRYIFKRHPWISRAIMIGDIAGTGYASIHNWSFGPEPTRGRRTVASARCTENPLLLEAHPICPLCM